MVFTATSARAQTIVRGPIIQNPDATVTTMTIEWWTDVTGDSTVEYGLTPLLGLSATVPQAASCEVGTAGTCHIVPLSLLLPGTRYYYRLLTNGVEVQPTNYFTTLKTTVDPSEIFFTVIGDFGQATGGEFDIANLQDAADPSLIVTVGDNAYNSGTLAEWDSNVLTYYQNPMRRMLFLPALGNHDVGAVGAGSWANSAEIKLFLLPPQRHGAGALLLLRPRRHPLHGPRQQLLLPGHPAGLARQRPRHHDAQVEARLPPSHTVLVRQRLRVDRQLDQRAQRLGTALRAARGRHRVRRARSHLRAHPLHGRLRR